MLLTKGSMAASFVFNADMACLLSFSLASRAATLDWQLDSSAARASFSPACLRLSLCSLSSRSSLSSSFLLAVAFRSSASADD